MGKLGRSLILVALQGTAYGGMHVRQAEALSTDFQSIRENSAECHRDVEFLPRHCCG